MKQLIILFLALISLGLTVYSQDKVIKKNGEIIECVVTEIGADEIKYHYDDRPKLTFGIDKALVDRIEFATGEVTVIDKDTFLQLEYYANQKQRAIKTGFLTLLNTNLEFTYEQSIKPGRSWETSLGIIGIGFDPGKHNPSGVFGKVAFKMMRTPDYYMHRMHYAHILKGGYIAPEFAFRYAEYDYEDWNSYDDNYNYITTRESDLSFVFTLKIGKQWVFDNFFLVDLYAGLGYGYSRNSKEYSLINYGFLASGNEFPVAFTSGLKIGILF
ncbi:MAG: hypothetical protein RBT19_00520 [Tenuifilaceae bacterium]|jgi:hypothetical protein|nr:hypothetical protein [Tenuifilaceae bacterium]